MEIPANELLDRLSILVLKRRHLGKEVEEEFKAYEEACYFLVEKWLEHNIDLMFLFDKLCEANEAIWGYESDLRNGRLGRYNMSQLADMTQEEILRLAAVGYAAVQIRNTNRIRKRLMDEIVDLTGSGWKSCKVDHASEEIHVKESSETINPSRSD